MIAEDGVLARHQADRRAVGRGRAVPGRQLSRSAGAGRNGTAATATTSAASGAASPAWPAPWPRASAAAPIFTRFGPPAAAFDQLHHLPRRLHALGPGLLQPQAQRGQRRRQPRRHATTTTPGTAASKGRPHDPDILGLRRRQAKNLLTTLLLSQGVPMLLAGDEFLRTQKGNNNAWCQDNEHQLGRLVACSRANADFLRFVDDADRPAQTPSRPAAARVLPRPRAARQRCAPDVIWHGVEPFQPDFSPGSRTLAFCLDGSQTERESRTAISTSPATPGSTRSIFAFRALPTAERGGAPSTRRSCRRSTSSATTTGRVVPPDDVYHVAAHSMIVLITEG